MAELSEHASPAAIRLNLRYSQPVRAEVAGYPQQYGKDGCSLEPSHSQTLKRRLLLRILDGDETGIRERLQIATTDRYCMRYGRSVQELCSDDRHKGYAQS